MTTQTKNSRFFINDKKITLSAKELQRIDQELAALGYDLDSPDLLSHDLDDDFGDTTYLDGISY